MICPPDQNSLLIAFILLQNLVQVEVSSPGHWWNEDFREESTDHLLAQQRLQLQQQRQQQDNRLHDGRRRSRNSKSKDILIGEICEPSNPAYSNCTPNANCILLEGETGHKCHCIPSFEPTLSKKCLRSWGTYCDSTSPCNHESYLSCIDNKCDCDNSNVYQDPEAGCQSKVGGPCSPSSGPDCVPYAMCKYVDSFGRSARCVCKEGYLETSDGNCSPGVGMSCNGKDECNQEIALVCKEGICSCRESVHVYDPEKNACVGLVGAQCCPNNLFGSGSTSTPTIVCPSGVNNGCISGAFCKKTGGGINIPGKCTCHPYNFEMDGRTCAPNPGFGIGVPGKIY